MTGTKPVLLVVDDEPGMVRVVERIAEGSGFCVESHGGGRETLPKLGAIRADVALIDLQMPEIGGLDVLRAIREANPECQVILMTAHASVDTAIEAVKLGALDYVSKPLPIQRVRQLLQGAREEIERRQALLRADWDTARRLEFCGMIGRSALMQQLFGLLRRLAPHVRSALIGGETGVGKELVARALHELGPRSQRRFAVVNCSAVVESLFESELFGHMRGAFTGATESKPGIFEAADGGTLFLDEVGELPMAVQAKLLRVLEAGEVHRVGSLEPRSVDVRVIAATNRDLHREVEAGRFRRDLLYRLNVVEIPVPPLRERREDIPYLAAAFIATFAERFGKDVTGITPAAERLLMAHEWPGNVRELRNTLERACMLAGAGTMTERELQQALPAETRPAASTPPAASPAHGSVLRRVQEEAILNALAEAGGNKTAAARTLGVSRRSLYRRLGRHAAKDPEVPK